MAEEFAPKLQTLTDIKAFGADNPQSDAALFQGLGNAVLQSAEVFDSAIQERIKKDATSLFEEANAPYQEGADLPSDITAAKSKLSRLQTAYDQGKLSDTSYYAQLVSGVKRIKSKYPGYENEIDGIIQQTTGVRPANAYRNALLQELDNEKTQAQKREKSWFDFVTKDSNMEAIAGSFPDLFSNPDKYADESKRAEVMTKVLEYNGMIGKNKLIKDSLAVDEATYNRNKQIISTNVNKYISYRINEDISGLNRMIETQFGSNLYNTLNKIATGKIKLDPMQQQQLIGQIKLKRDSLYAKLQTEIGSNTNGFKNPTEIKEQLDAAMQSYDNIINSMQAGQWDIAGQYSRSIKTMQERDIWNLKASKDTIRVYDTLNEISPDLAQKWSLSNADEITQTIDSITVDNLNFGNKTLEEAVKGVQSSGELTDTEKAKGIKESIDSLTRQLSDPSGDQTQWNTVFNSVYADENVFKYFGNESQTAVFLKLTSPSITSKVVANADSGAIEQYYNWTIKQLSNLGDIRQQAQETNAVNYTSDIMSAEVNEKGILSYYIDVKNFEAWAKDKTPAAQAGMVKALKDSVTSMDNFNRILSHVNPIIDATEGNRQEQIRQIISNLGVNLDARQNSFLGTLSNWFDKFDVMSSEADKEKATERNLQTIQQFLSEHPEIQSDLPVHKTSLDASKFEDYTTSNKLAVDLSKRKSVPVSIRNNNMGAISITGSIDKSWAARQPGFVGTSPRPKNEGGHYAKYATPEHGVAAASNLLKRYGSNGINTPIEIVSKWAAAGHEAYARTLVKYLNQAGFNVDKDTALDLNNKRVRLAILKAKSAHESGLGKPVYKSDVFLRGVDMT